jgi:DUF1365 family protein
MTVPALVPESLPASGLYRGTVMHHRLAPKRNFFTYPVFVFVLDPDELPDWDRRLRLFRHNRFSLFSLRDEDYFPGRTGTIKEKAIALLRERGCPEAIDRVMMITQMRVLGHVFNPVTFYYCYRDGREVAHVAEITNTFRQRHSYAFFGGATGLDESGKEKGPTYFAEKVFYVSPFLEMNLTYSFHFAPLGRDLAVHVDDFESGKPVLKTWIRGVRGPLNDRALLASFLRLPFMSAWILGWIHWQALKLWLRRIPLVFRPADGMKPAMRNEE